MDLSKYNVRSIFSSALGIVILSLGISINKGSVLGMDTYTGMNTTVSTYFDMSLGNYQLVLNIILLLSMFVFGRYLLGLGTVLNMVFVGYLVDFFLKLFDGTILSFDVEKSIWVRLILLIAGTIILCLGASLYMTADLGVAPYDALAIMMSDHIKGLPFSIARIITDVICVIVGLIFGTVLGSYAFGTIIGIGTVLTAFGTGPFIDFFNKTISAWIVGKNQMVETKQKEA
ncbi:YczE/YyaS/YitT family protein [Enterococcus sp. AZ103]|uniref:YczE/YyaS/YitT family protein n=1 Tax=Enterococcus sp. AZ103 TaxID=2774628 RepID=UPI003F25C77A